MPCPDAINLAAEHIVRRIEKPGDDRDALHDAAVSWLHEQIAVNA